MVFMQNELPLPHDDSNQVSVAVRTVSGVSKEDLSNKDRQDSNAFTLDVNSFPTLGNHVSFSEVTDKTTGLLMEEHGKRPLCDDGASKGACKRSKSVEQNPQGSLPLRYSSIAESFPAAPEEEHCIIGTDAVLKDDANKVVSCGWSMCNIGEEKTDSLFLDHPLLEESFPSYFGDYHEAFRYSKAERSCMPFFDYHPRKPVALGPNYQAVIPKFRSNQYETANENSSYCASLVKPMPSLPSSYESVIDDDDSAVRVGRCIMPMPDSASLASDFGDLNCKFECSCLDEGSIRCVRQHIMEAREELKKTLGEDKFVELGFCDMGEDVAKNWTEEEEQAFYEVVFSYPVSSGKNFWDELPRVFPTRTMKELVSYYFNVFMLRKRAVQNRMDPLNADSDNDEWQESSDSQFVMEEEDEEEEEDSFESLADQNEVNSENEDFSINEAAIVDGGSSEGCNGSSEDDEVYGFSDGCIGSKSEFISDVQLTGKNSDSFVDEQDNKDNSLTLFEGLHNGNNYSSSTPVDFVGMQDKLTEEHEHREHKDDGHSSLKGHELSEGHHNMKAWEVTFTCRTEKDGFSTTTSKAVEGGFTKEASKGAS